jgi:hypothetical protein
MVKASTHVFDVLLLPFPKCALGGTILFLSLHEASFILALVSN